jgi:hypothetical protein
MMIDGAAWHVSGLEPVPGCLMKRFARKVLVFPGAAGVKLALQYSSTHGISSPSCALAGGRNDPASVFRKTIAQRPFVATLRGKRTLY